MPEAGCTKARPAASSRLERLFPRALGGYPPPGHLSASPALGSSPPSDERGARGAVAPSRKGVQIRHVPEVNHIV
eukprot:13735616-Alexandrium_andersonii.AAC.1